MTFLEYRQWKYCIFIVKNSFSDTSKGNGDTIVSSTFFVDDCVSGITNTFEQFNQFRFLNILSVFKEFFKVYTGDVSVWPNGKFWVTVFTHDVGVNWTSVNIKFFSKCLTETSWVKWSTWTDNAFFRESWEFPCWVSQYVNWVSCYKEDSFEAWFNNLSNDRFVDSKVFTNKIKTSFTWFLWSTSSDNYKVSIRTVFVFSCVDFFRWSESKRVAKVKRITNSFFEQLWNFDDTKFLSDTLVYKCESVRWTYGTVTNEDDFFVLFSCSHGSKHLLIF